MRKIVMPEWKEPKLSQQQPNNTIARAKAAVARGRAFMERVTPGPWAFVERKTHGYGGPNGKPDERVYAVEIIGDMRCADCSPWTPESGKRRWSSRIIAVIQDWAGWTDHPANRDFIAFARTYVPASITALESAVRVLDIGAGDHSCSIDLMYGVGCTCDLSERLAAQAQLLAAVLPLVERLEALPE